MSTETETETETEIERRETHHDGLEDLVSDRGKDALVKVEAKRPVDGGERIDSGLGQHTERDVDHLQICKDGR